MDLVDASALLWRLDLMGADVGDRWEAVSLAWEGISDGRLYPFNDFHAAMAHLAQVETMQSRLCWRGWPAPVDLKQRTDRRNGPTADSKGFADFRAGSFRDAANGCGRHGTSRAPLAAAMPNAT